MVMKRRYLWPISAVLIALAGWTVWLDHGSGRSERFLNDYRQAWADRQL